ncbi:H2A super protein, partial [Podila epigama]
MRKKYKTKFPVARIKKIMQMDEDVGKVAQATPILISKALELFMQSLIDEACMETRAKNAKRLTAAHLKKTILDKDQFDFLRDIVENVADPQGSTGATSSSTGQGEEAGAEEDVKMDEEDSGESLSLPPPKTRAPK